jgi:hypothetical protein
MSDFNPTASIENIQEQLIFLSSALLLFSVLPSALERVKQ